jgi:hypothetical protein
VDPETEMAAANMNRLVAQVTMLSHTFAKAWVYCTISGLTISVTDHDAVWGNTDAVKPTATRLGNGHFEVAWATAYNDLQDDPESHSVSIRACLVSVSNAGGANLLSDWVITGANTVEVYTKNTSATAISPGGFLLIIL